MNVKPLLKLMVEKKASDLFFAPYSPAKIKIEGKIMPVNKLEMSPKMVRQAAFELMTEEQMDEADPAEDPGELEGLAGFDAYESSAHDNGLLDAPGLAHLLEVVGVAHGLERGDSRQVRPRNGRHDRERHWRWHFHL